MSRYSNPSSGLFGICAETLRRYSCPFTIPGQDAPRPLPSPARVLSFFPAGWKCQPEGEDIGSGCCGGGVIQLRSRERALLRQGQLFEPAASSGPAAMVLAISRNLSCTPRRSPCPGRYPLPLASAFLSTFRNLSSSPDSVPPATKKAGSSVHSLQTLTQPKSLHPSKKIPYFIFANLSTALVKFSIVLSASPCSIPSLTQCWICPSSTTCPTLCKADFAALI